MPFELSDSTHVIFDLGQTIVDFTSTVIPVFEEYAKSKGKHWQATDFGDFIPNEIDKSSELFEKFLISIGDDSYKYPDKFAEFVRQIDASFSGKELKMIPGVDRLIKHLHDNNIPMAIASNATLKEVKGGLETTVGLNPSLFTHVVAGADDPEVKVNKPAPDVFHVCAKRFEPPPKTVDSCVIFEDSIRGITGAVASGMKAVLISDMSVDAIGAIADKITVIVDSFNNFKPESVGLPPY